LSFGVDCANQATIVVAIPCDPSPGWRIGSLVASLAPNAGLGALIRHFQVHQRWRVAWLLLLC
jgi:hypothetical protein